MPNADPAGQLILNTRPVQQAGSLSQQIRDHGGRVLEFPVIEIAALPDNPQRQQRIQQLDHYDMVIFVSANAVHYGLAALAGQHPLLSQRQLACVGQATTRALQKALGEVEILTPASEFNSEGLLAEPALQQVHDKKILIVRGKEGREHLATSLRTRGATVDYLEVYERRLPDTAILAKLRTEVEQNLQNNALAAIVITSGEGLQNLQQLIDSRLHPQLHNTQLVVINTRLATLASEMGFQKPAWVTTQADDAAIIKVMQDHQLLAE